MKSNKIRNAARGKPCTLQIVGVCNGNTETTVLAHLPDESNGMGKKSDDISACFACSSCHDAIDSRGKMPESEKPFIEWYMRRAMVRTWRMLIDDGVIKL
jgi:hypothetical protein